MSNKIYDFVNECIVDGIEREGVVEQIVSRFGVEDIYAESNLRFYLDEETQEIFDEADGSKNMIHLIEKGDTICEIKEMLFEHLDGAVYNIFQDKEGDEYCVIGLSELNHGNKLFEYIFSTLIDDINGVLYKLSVV